ncbi:hypothetical protein D8674_020993 [Pyrus ussuriensis x Pyrus communis]|uniref:Uncharacterized protein n=1 Tax=Pyrus ussuriensis x Pyrus communis TaxID=2448454 RepID=A0A5N5HHR7_9ROSA|nr:hypothetical protein D8674_020993 [Pyrus ussuriensis x Pyrus communis]
MAFDAILFRNAECSLKYTNDFSNRVIVPCKIAQYPFFRKFKFGFKKWFDNQLLRNFVQTEEVVYPRLVRMFFANLQMNVEGTTLTSRVNGVNITVNPSVLAMIYSIPESGPIQVHHNKIQNIGKSRRSLGFERPEEMLGRCSGEGLV